MEALINPSLYVALGVGFLFLAITNTIITYTFTAATVMVIDQNKKDQKITSLVKSGFKYIIPLFLTGLLVSFFTIGGLMFFLIPALIFSFFFMFSMFEVILEKKSPLNALKGSYKIVSHNFGEILVRMLAFVFLYIALTVFIPNIVMKADETTGTILSFYSIIVNSLLAWYGIVFNITLYKQAKAVTNTSEKTSLAWIWVVAIMGWLMFIPFFGGIKALVNSKDFQEGFKKEGSCPDNFVIC